MSRSSRRALIIVGVALAMAAAGSASALAHAGPLHDRDLQAVRAAVARYHSYDQALAAGYSAEGEACVSSPAGTMGYHAGNPALGATMAVDALQPEVLLYVPRADGSLRLAGVEYWQIALANTESGPSPWFDPAPPPLGFFNPAPSVLGRTFDGPMPGHNSAMPWHYDLHVWVIDHNPNGLFSPFNPALSCD